MQILFQEVWGRGLRFCVSGKCQVMPILLIHGLDSEKQGPKALHHQLYLARGRVCGGFLWARLGNGIQHIY